MTKELTTKRLHLGVATWASETTDPNAGGGTAADVGSWWQRPSTGANVPTWIYLKLSTSNVGWGLQNYINLTVYNVKDFGAVGNGSTDDTTAINNTITAALAAGGGIVYFPPGTYKVTKPGSGFGSIQLSNAQDLIFLGDGYASQIKMIGSAAAGDWYMWRTRNGTKRIKWINLYMDGAGVTNPDPGEQNHGLSLQGVSGDANNGTSDCDIVGCYFGRFVGDAIRPLGATSTQTVENIRVLYNAFDLNDGVNGSRSGIEAQRYVRRLQLHFNWMTGSHDSEIDFEPTGGTPPTAGPDAWSIIGNHISHNANTIAFSLSGIDSTDPNKRCLVHYTTISGPTGGHIEGLNIDGLSMVGNIVICNTTNGDGVIQLYRFAQNLLVDSNIVISQNTTNNRHGFDFINGNATFPKRIVCSNNISNTMGTNGTIPIWFNVDQGVCIGNICYADITVASNGGIVNCRRDADAQMNNVNVIGNIGVGTNQILSVGVDFHGITQNIANTQALWNLFRNCERSVTYSRATTETYPRYHGASGNSIVGAGALGNVTPPPTNVGAMMEGCVGPGAQIALINNAGGPTASTGVPAVAGSLCTNESGGLSSTLSYKESGSGVSGGTSGWFSVGGHDLVMGTAAGTTATAARFLAPGGMDLASESTVEIQWAVPRAGTLRNLRVRCTIGTGVSNVTYRIRKNGVDTALLVTISVTAATGSNTSNTVTVAAGDLISLKTSKSAAPTTGQTNIECTFELAD